MGGVRNSEQECSTFHLDAQLFEGLLHGLALPLAHEAVVDVHGDDLVAVQGPVQQGRAHRGVHAPAEQHLAREKGRNPTLGQLLTHSWGAARRGRAGH